MRSITIAAAAAAMFAPLVAADNQAIVYNFCSFPVYLWAVDASACTDGTPARNPIKPQVLSPGGQYSEEMRELISGGVSIKLASFASLSQPITQFEYTKNTDTWYDVSNVNCYDTASCPFTSHGFHLQSGDGCPTVTCPPGATDCHSVYNLYNDDWASLCCPTGNPDVVFYLCTDKPEPISSYGPPAPPPPPQPKPSVEEESVPNVTPKPKPPKPTTTLEPATQVVEVTEVSTVVVTVTPKPRPAYERRSRHVHAHAHAHRF